MQLLHAQGGGFYGCAICTVDLDLQTIVQRLSRNANIGATLPPNLDEARIELGKDTHVLIRAWDGQPQPLPVLVFDTGHADEDMAALNLVLDALGKFRPGQIVEDIHSGYRGRVVRSGPSPGRTEDGLAIAGSGTVPGTTVVLLDWELLNEQGATPADIHTGDFSAGQQWVPEDWLKLVTLPG